MLPDAPTDHRFLRRSDVLPAEYEQCFGCGTENAFGIALSDIRIDGSTVHARFLPHQQHQGFPNVLHGGVIASALDEAMSYACVLTTGRWCATIKTEIRYRSPLPVNEWLDVEAGIERKSSGRNATWSKLLLPDGRVGAEATAVFVAVPETMFGGLVPPYLQEATAQPSITTS
jgi:acyl-coenzyme A thioesterase PaaI-like protein